MNKRSKIAREIIENKISLEDAVEEYGASETAIKLWVSQYHDGGVSRLNRTEKDDTPASLGPITWKWFAKYWIVISGFATLLSGGLVWAVNTFNKQAVFEQTKSIRAELTSTQEQLIDAKKKQLDEQRVELEENTKQIANLKLEYEELLATFKREEADLLSKTEALQKKADDFQSTMEKIEHTTKHSSESALKSKIGKILDDVKKKPISENQVPSVPTIFPFTPMAKTGYPIGNPSCLVKKSSQHIIECSWTLLSTCLSDMLTQARSGKLNQEEYECIKRPDIAYCNSCKLSKGHGSIATACYMNMKNCEASIMNKKQECSPCIKTNTDV